MNLGWLAHGSMTPRAITMSLCGIACLGGCTGTWLDNRPDHGRVSLALGVTRACHEDPCAVTLALPSGEGQYTVRANGRVVGTYPGGQPADLGAFGRQESPVTLTVDGVERSAAVLYLLERRGN